MPHPDDLWSHVSNTEVVSSALGALPSLHDAEIISLELSREGDPTARISFSTMPFPGQTTLGQVVLLFSDIDDVELTDFNHQNVIYTLTIDEDGDRKKLTIQSSFGLEGSFSFAAASVVSAEAALAT